MTTISEKRPSAGRTHAKNQISVRANTIMNITLIIACVFMIIPLWIIIVSSMSSESAITTYGYTLWPREFSVSSYGYLFKKGSIVGTAYMNTIVATVAGTVLSVITVGLYAYPLSRPEFKARNVFMFISFFTMLFSGGMVSFYVTCRNILGLNDTVFALFLPMSFSAYWVIIMRTFYKTNVPDSIIESARIDGSGEWRTLIQIVMPLAVPGLATVALFSAIGIWNNFFNCMLLNDTAQYYNLQYMIYQTMNNMRFLKENAAQMGANVNLGELPSETYRMAMAVVTVGPIIMAYPFFQRYFIKGLTIGAVKG